MLEAKWAEGKFVCVGLDPEWEKIPQVIKHSLDARLTPRINASFRENVLYAFCRSIVDATHDLVCAFKPNAAFFEAEGPDGAYALESIIRHINEVAPGVPVIYDAKRADIGNTNKGYVQDAFGMLHADAITVHPYLGQEALQPFLDQKDKGIIVLCRTSNKGAGEFQERYTEISKEEAAVFPVAFRQEFETVDDSGPAIFKVTRYFAKSHLVVAHRVSMHWNVNNNCLLVVGATYPHELSQIRALVGDLPLLLPGIGAQGGDLEKTVLAGKDSHGQGMIINSSRGIIYASSGEDYAEAARRETLKLHEAIKQTLQKGQQ